MSSRLVKQNRNRNSADATPHPLSPPRPFFLASEDSGSLSDSSDKEQGPAPRVPHSRRRSTMASNSSSYAPVAAAGTPTSPGFSSRRRLSNGNPFEQPEATGYAYSQDHDTYAPLAGPGAEDHEMSPTVAWSPNSLYNDVDESGRRSRPPPSSYQFPFQAHPGNPDPIPRRRSNSFESLTTDNHRALSENSHDLPMPSAPFMATSSSSSSISGMNNVYRSSAVAGMMSPSQTALNAAYMSGQSDAAHDLGSPAPPFAQGIPRTSSQTFRAPFLSPASRPSSTLWSPPSYIGTSTAANGSSTALALPAPPAPAPSTRLSEKLTKEQKPWLTGSAPRARISWWLTVLCMFIGIAGAALLCFFGFQSTSSLVFKESQLCSVLSDDFSGGLDLQGTWNRDIQAGGFGNAEFQMTSGFDNVSYVKNGQLYIFPQLTEDWLGVGEMTSGTIQVPDCSTDNVTACTMSGNGVDSVMNPVMSARINTLGHYDITYGRVEVVAKLPRGDWLWPAVWMLPVNGTWPLGGEMDIMEARGNGPAYSAQGTNFVRSTVQYGPFSALVKLLYGWYGLKQQSFDAGFHTYGMEWDEGFVRFYVDTRVHTTLQITTKSEKQGFWDRAGFPATAQNGSAEVVVGKPDSYTNVNSPFDQPFYLIIDLAVGGTSGWFPDNVGGKPWFDGSLTAMFDFWKQQSTWFATWPDSDEDRAFRIDSVKMWKKC